MTEKNPTAAPDAELDRWLNLFAAYGNTSESVEPGSLQKYQDMRAAIHAHVAQVRQEAHDIGFRRGLRGVW